ncbi:hypothetical protein PPERSA_02849 [Pseudocohnilembus persalinus]|uniref:MaoC-like domain-containing protein n=1 Tax=Pseudocohnilembus persalinus TaxID=266149 RepID=A0A0V0QMI5_PSEPJ|nr:hypothetical protein PPERSA_02849 [Pseudocohnilembus persalinus]|eukprot:KRX03470.1 hypothetical protein PPERSA_02849 [Pseudocohnilembus persalinus]
MLINTKNILKFNILALKELNKATFFNFSKQIKIGENNKEIGLGDYIILERSYNRQDVTNFGNVIQDFSPIHQDEQYAATTQFKKCLVYGMQTGSVFSGMIGNAFPGIIYLGQTLQFKSPVYIDEVLTNKVEVVDIDDKKKQIKLKTTVEKKDEKKIAVIGEATVYYKTIDLQVRDK